jgi:hypothetical protein
MATIVPTKRYFEVTVALMGGLVELRVYQAPTAIGATRKAMLPQNVDRVISVREVPAPFPL